MCILGQLIYLFSKNNDTESMLGQLSKEEREVCATEAGCAFLPSYFIRHYKYFMEMKE